MNKYDGMLDRFLKYVKINTQSDEDSTRIPSTNCQVDFINSLKQELLSMGLKNVRVNSQSGYLFADLTSNTSQSLPSIGFLAHVDTADFNSENINPQVIKKIMTVELLI